MRHSILKDEAVRAGLAVQGGLGLCAYMPATSGEYTVEAVTHTDRHIYVHTAVEDCGGLNCSHARVSGGLLTVHYVWSIV